MKIRVIFALFISMLVLSPRCQSQAIDAGNAGVYIVKKRKETIASIAKKLKIEPRVLAELNSMASINQVLTEGESIKIPVSNDVNTNGGEHESNKVNPVDSVNDSSSIAKDKQVHGAKNYNYEIQKNRLLLIDATLELNEALMQGVKASIDSLNKDDKGQLDEKNIQAAQYKMQRSRDKALLKPYLTYFEDSLGKEILALKREKEQIERGMSGTELQEAKADTFFIEKKPETNVAPAESKKQEVADNVLPEKDTAATTKNIKPEGAEISPPPVVEYKLAIAIDTTTVTESIKEQPKVYEPEIPPVENKMAVLYDTTSVLDSRPIAKMTYSPIPKPAASADLANKEKPVEAHVHWKTARALPPIPENSFPRDIMETIANESPLPPVVNGDTEAYIPHATKSSMAQNASDRPLELDTIDHLKAQLLLTKGLKAMNDKNYTDAEQYLKKSVDLEHYYYDAWLALADVHVRMGLYAQGLNEYKICEKLNTRSTKLYAKMGQAAYKLKMPDEAYLYYQKSLKIDSDYIPAIEGRAIIFAERKQYDTAISEYNRALLINRSYHSIYKMRGIAEYMNKDYAASIDDLTRFLIFQEKDPAAHYYRGMAKIAHKEPYDGCVDLTAAAKLGYPAAEKMIQKNCTGKK